MRGDAAWRALGHEPLALVRGGSFPGPGAAQAAVSPRGAGPRGAGARRARGGSDGPGGGRSHRDPGRGGAGRSRAQLRPAGGGDALLASRYREGAAKAQFYPRFTPRYQRSAGSELLGLDLSQKLPWTGATVTAGGTLTATPENENPFPRAADLRFVVTQPLLRGFGANATSFDLQNSRRGRISQERNLELSKQRLAGQVTEAFYGVIAQRPFVAVFRPSLKS